MDLSTFSLFATGLAVGIAASLPFVPLAPIGRRFFILMSLLAVAFLALATVDRGLGIGYGWIGCAALLIAYNLALPAQRSDPGATAAASGPSTAVSSMLVIASVAAGAWGIVEHAATLAQVPEGTEVGFGGLIAIEGTRALLLGSSVVAMVLGHWYLVVRGITFEPLRRLTKLLTFAILSRCAATGFAVVVDRALWSDRFASAGFFLSDGIFIASRLLFGLALPLVLVRLVWGCLRVESNQSATGILYVIVAFVLLAELLAAHFLLHSGLVT